MILLCNLEGDRGLTLSQYANIMGSLKYVIDYTRLDIGYVVGLLRKFTSWSIIEHWNVVERVDT